MIKNQRGFSLTEMMVVVGILGIMGLIAVPTLVTALPGYRLKSSARDLCSNMRKARSLAVKQNRNVIIEFHVDNNTYIIINNNERVALADGVSFGYGNATTAGSGASLPSDGISFVDDKVAFTTQGLISGGSGYVYLQNSKGQAYRVGARTSGSIIMQQWVGNAWK
jgi:prepilin-type N-terminal cleavage/methylation domain-containing protein